MSVLHDNDVIVTLILVVMFLCKQ